MLTKILTLGCNFQLLGELQKADQKWSAFWFNGNVLWHQSISPVSFSIENHILIRNQV